MVLFSEMFFSELEGVPVIDRLEKPIGRVLDILLVLGEQFPRVSGLLIKTVNGKEKVLLIGEIDLIGSQFVSTQSTKERLVLGDLRYQDILLRKNVLDQQIVDTSGARVLRVNDIKLAKVGPDVRVIAVDVGMRGMIRRLGIEWLFDFLFGLFRKKVPDRLIGWNYVQLLEADLAKGQITIPHKSVDELHPADIADVISNVHVDERTAIFASLPDKTAAEALHELEPKIQAILLLTIDTRKALSILNRMPVDEAADVLGDITPEKADELLRLMRVRKAHQIRGLMKHKDETAGGLMTTEFITVPQNLTVEQVISRLREIAPDAETIYYIYVVDDLNHLAGALSLRSLIVSPPEKPITDIMIKDMIAVAPDMNQREVAGMISKYNLLALPVVDADKKILGIITVDDVVDFILPPISRRKRQMLG